jgi:hypothetical protein
MANFYVFYPPGGAGSANASVASNGGSAASSSTEIGFIGAGNIQTAVSASTPLPVVIEPGSFPNPLPTEDAADGATGAAVPAIAIQVAGNKSGTLQALALNSGGELLVHDQTGDSALNTISTTVGTPGSVANSTALVVAGVNSATGHSQFIGVDAAGDVKVVGIGTPGAQAGGVLTVQGDPSGTPINVQLSGSAAEVSVNLNQIVGTTTATGLGASNAGTQRVAISSDSSITTIPSADVAPATQNITTQDLASTTTAQANGQNVITGTPTAGSAASFAISSEQSIETEVTGTWTGTLSSEISFDGGVTWFTRGLKQAGASYLASSFTANFQGGANITGVTNYRVRASAAMTGTATVKVIFSLNEASIVVSNPLTLRDATVQSITNTIKAASTAAVATDTALVVAISPNNPITAGGSLAQGSTTSGQLGNLSMGAVTSTPPSYTTGQTDPLSLDVNGNLRVIDTTEDANIGPASPGTASTRSGLSGGVYNSSGILLTNGQQAATQFDQFGNTEVVMPDMVVTGQAAQTAIVNNILTTTAGTAATLVDNYRAATVQVVSTGTAGTFIFEGSNDNVNFQTIPVYSQLVLTGTPIVAAITATASSLIYTFPVSVNYIRLRIVTTITGGSIQAFSRIEQATWTPAVFQVAQATAANLNVTASIGAGVAVIGASAVAIPLTVADIASAAITTTTTTAAITPASGSGFIVDIPVTAVSGTNPTLSVAVQQSADAGTNWETIYTFPLITTTGSYVSPFLLLNGNRIRYVQTITGTTPSFTRAINRLQSNAEIEAYYKNLIDTTINPTSTNSVTPSVFVENTNTYTAIVNQGSGGSAVQFALDGSDDNVNWILALATVYGVTGGATPVNMTYSGSNFRYIRVRVVTGVAATTISYVSLVGAIGGAGLSRNGVSINGSGSTSGTPSTSTQVFAANPNRKYLLIQNLGTASIYINFTSAADTTNSIWLAPGTSTTPGGSFVQEAGYVSSEIINILSPSASTPFMAKQG